MTAINQAELIAVTQKEFAKLEKLLEVLTEEEGRATDPEDGVSIQQVIGHRTHWIDLFFTWYEHGKAGKDVQTPAPGYKWNQLKSYNAQVYQLAAEESWPATLSAFTSAHEKLLAFMAEHDDTVLYTKHLYPWMNDWTLGRWAEASGPSHYRSAAKFVRKVLKRQGARA